MFLINKKSKIMQKSQSAISTFVQDSFSGIRVVKFFAKEKYIENFGNAYECRSPNSKALWKLFQSECDKTGIIYKMSEIISAYKEGYGSEQLSLF